MPELPEVETTRRVLEPVLVGRRIESVRVHQHQLRWPIPPDLDRRLEGRTVSAVGRRAKYLLIATETGTTIVHLGMSGSLRLADPSAAPGLHDHLELFIEDGPCIRLRDPRRFGAVLWGGSIPMEHPLLASLGPEPLGNSFSGDHLHHLSRGRRVAVKNFIMNGHVVVGVGNIYASEALFAAQIHPQRAAGRISRQRFQRLAEAIRAVLIQAVNAGGTTLRDYVHGANEVGEFTTSLCVYGREGQACVRCSGEIRLRVIGQRSSFYCPRCQS